MTIALIRAPFNAFNLKDPRQPMGAYGLRGAQLSETQLKYDYEKSHGGYCNGSILTKEAWETMADVMKQANRYNYDDSDGMIDYFSTKFYLHLEIGRWDKPFER